MRLHYVVGFAQCCFAIGILGLGLTASAGPAPSLEITVSCPPDAAKWGDPLVVSGTVTNTGKITITNIVITESSSVGDGPITTLLALDPGQELAFSGSWRLVPSNTCSVTHNVFAIGTSTHGDGVTNTASAACQVAPHTRLDVAIDCPPTPPVPGQLFNFTGSFTNKSDYVVTSTLLYVYQAGSNVLTMPVRLLYPGESASFSGSYLLPTNGPAAALITNTYIMVGASYCGYPASNMVTQVCSLQVQRPKLQILFNQGNPMLSWSSLPSGFVLQRNPDLRDTNWQDMTNVPLLFGNYNQVILPPTAPSAFYRLRLNP